jgi:hypothetical protein
MKKILGLAVTLIGILIIGGGFVLTPAHAYNPADSISGVNASAALVFSGFITFGAGLVIFISSQPYAGERNRQSVL